MQVQLPNVRLQTLDVSRASQLADVHQSCFTDGWGEAACRQLLSMPAVTAAIAVTDRVLHVDISDNILGFIVTQHAAFEMEILSIGVTPAARNRKIGQAILSQTLAAAQTAKITAVFLEVSEHNHAAIQLYQHLQFQSVGKRKNYYAMPNGEHKDAFIYKKILTPENKKI